MPGPPRTPTAILEQRGSWRAKQRRDAGEPTLEPSRPDCPAWVVGSARQYWPQLAALLFDMGVMADAHTPALALLVNSLARYLECEAMLTDTGVLTDGRRNPVWMARNKAWEQVFQALREFGLTPASLSRVKVAANAGPTVDAGDEREDILAKINGRRA